MFAAFPRCLRATAVFAFPRCLRATAVFAFPRCLRATAVFAFPRCLRATAVFAYTQLNPFHPLSTLNIIHIRKDTRLSPALGEPGEEASLASYPLCLLGGDYIIVSHNFFCIDLM